MAIVQRPGRRQRVLRQAGHRARDQPRRGPAAQRDVDHRDEHQVDQPGAGCQKACNRGLQCQGDGNGQGNAERPHEGPSSGCRLRRRRLDDEHFLEPVEINRRPYADGLVNAVAAADRLDSPDDEALRIDPVDARRHDRVAHFHVGGGRPRSPCARCPRPLPTTMPCARDRSTSAPAAALRSISSCTFDACSGGRHDAAHDTRGRDDRHVGRDARSSSLGRW